MKKALKLISIFSISISFCIFFSRASAQIAPEIEWQNTIGGTEDDFLNSIQQTSDGGYILGGTSSSPISGDKTQQSKGWEDYWVVKLNSEDDIEWQRTIGGSYQDFLESVEQTPDSGYILGGTSSSGISGDKTEGVIGITDYWIVKLDKNGAIEWDNTIGGNSVDALSSIQPTSDGGYIIIGVSFSGISGDKTEGQIGEADFWVVKLNSEGNIEWQNTIGGLKQEDFPSIDQTVDEGYILGGSSASGISGDKTEASLGLDDYWVIKLNSAGEIEWQNAIGGTGYDYLFSLQQTSDAGYILGGYSESGISGDKTEAAFGDGDYWVVKLNSTGVIEWQNTIGGDGHESWPLSTKQTADGGYILGGTSSSDSSGNKTEDSEGSRDYWVVKLNGDGSIKWQSTIGGDTIEALHSTQQCADGGYILGGASHSGISGDKTEVSHGKYDYWVVKLYADGCGIPASPVTVSVNSSSAVLSWEEVATVPGYKVRYKVAGTSDWIPIQSADNDKTLNGLTPNTEYVWQVKSICAVNPIISSVWSEKQFFTTNSLKEAFYENLQLDIYPNPFSSSTTISFSSQQDSQATFELYDLSGRKLQTVLDKNVAAGNHEEQLHRDYLSAGIYFLKLKMNGDVVTKKVVIQ
jgi:hypothetical protein